jgi:gas vesicle protein
MAGDIDKRMLWCLAGLGIGTALGILYAPKPGHETRKAIRSAAEKRADAVTDHARRYYGHAGQAVNRVRDYMKRQTTPIRLAFEAGRQAYRQAISTAAPALAVSDSTPELGRVATTSL